MYLAIDSLDINDLVMRKQNDWNPFLVVLISFIKDHREEELQERPIREEREIGRKTAKARILESVINSPPWAFNLKSKLNPSYFADKLSFQRNDIFPCLVL